MMDFAEARVKMVDCQVRPNDVTNHDLIDAMLSVPREEFVPSTRREFAYIDEDMALEVEGRYLMEPCAFAKLAQLAEVRQSDVVLVVGSGSGYGAAVISTLCDSVVAVEENSVLAAQSERVLSNLGYDNVAVINSSHAGGSTREAPFDVIFIDGSVSHVPGSLLAQLNNGGRLVVVEGEGNAAKAQLFTRDGDNFARKEVFNCAIRPMPGFEREAEFQF